VATPGVALAVTVGSVPAAVEAQRRPIAEITERAGGTMIEVLEADRWWRRAADVTWPLEESQTSLTLRIGTRPTDVAKAHRALEAVGTAGAELRATADLANGVLHAALTPIEPRRVADVVGRTRDALASLGGSCVVEHAPAEAKRGLDVWGDVGSALGAMRRLKQELDPQNVLNAGRYVGGI
jgi:FAD/FMN-containing dehydrogenase